LASIAVKNWNNGTANPDSLFDSSTTVEAALNSDPVADPLWMYEYSLL
jgi:acetyl-CoA acetyltransferase